ncbi:MAG TPA: alpha/beta fold hydrolase [Candidatus Saccharimonadales bacterium]|nr:alpha/beta fold hydrolase [Candidatus Saccharimonadales bacterium]
MTPDQYTIQEIFVDVGHGHTLYVQEWGDTRGLPIIFLHGGPGNGCNDTHRQTFDPDRQHVIFIDQRGTGRSLPHGSMAHNTTQDLIADIEKVVVQLKLPPFVLTGGSWGSCLALAYGLAHPKRVRAMVLDGIFTGSQSEINYLDQGSFQVHFPDVWEWLTKQVPRREQADPVTHLAHKALGNGPASIRAAYLYGQLERSLLSLDDRFTPPPLADYDPSSIRIELYYMKNRCFMPDQYILQNAHRLSMPVWLIQGRYDMVCPGKTAYALHKRLKNSELIWATSGHRGEREVWNIRRSILLQLAKGVE